MSKIKLYANKKYWRIKYLLIKIKFAIKNICYYLMNKSKNKKEEIKVNFDFWLNSIFHIIKSLIIVFLLFIIEFLIFNYLFPIFIKKNILYNIISEIKNLNYDDVFKVIIIILPIISSITGLLLGLFYPTLSSIISSVYSNVPNDIRLLIINNTSTKKLLNNLATILSICIIILTSLFFSMKPNLIILSIIVTVTIKEIFNITKIGLGVFNFLDPNILINDVMKDMINNIKRIFKGNLFGLDKNFQNYFSKTTNNEIDRLDIIFSLTIKNYHSGYKIYNDLLSKVYLFFNYYIQSKNKILSNSLWFPYIPKHNNYFLSDITKRELSQNGRFFVYPDKNNDYGFIERRIINLIINNTKLLKNDKYLPLTIKHIFLKNIETSRYIGKNIDIESVKLFFDYNYEILQIIKSNNFIELKEYVEVISLNIGSIEKIFLSLFEKIKNDVIDNKIFNKDILSKKVDNKNVIYEVLTYFDLKKEKEL